jgi:hypothetical protein
MASAVTVDPTRSHPSGGPNSHRPAGSKLLFVTTILVAGLLGAGCQRGPSEEMRRLDRVDLKIQQLEQRLNKFSLRSEDGSDKAGKPPAGVIKSLTFRIGSEDDRLRIYWADGSRTDLPCTKEQSTYVCG